MEFKNHLFPNMLRAALDRLESRSPDEISRLGNLPFDGNAFHFHSFGKAVAVTYPDYQITPSLQEWHILSLLHYLATADGALLTGRQITFAQCKDGMIRGGGFDRDAEKLIREKLGTLPPEELKRRCLSLGAVLLPSNADLCAGFYFMPNYPIWLKIWFADDEFPASGRLLLDASAEHYLSIEDAVTVGELLLNLLLQGGSV